MIARLKSLTAHDGFRRYGANTAWMFSEQIITLLKKNPKYANNDLMRILNKADGTIKEHLANLKNEGILKRVGSTKNGHWKIEDRK